MKQKSSTKDKNYTQLKEFCLKAGADLFGVADISAIKKDFMLSQKLLEYFDRAVCLGVGLSVSILNEIESAPTRLYFHHYRTANMFLDQLAFSISGHIQNKGYRTLPIPASQIVDWQLQKGHLSHKGIARLAGLGWIGRNNLLVNKRLGSSFRLVTLLTDMPLATNKPTNESCGECRLCIEACPAKAIGNSREDFNFQRCFEKLKEFQKQRLVDQYICGVCVKACTGGKNG